MTSPYLAAFYLRGGRIVAEGIYHIVTAILIGLIQARGLITLCPSFELWAGG